MGRRRDESVWFVRRRDQSAWNKYSKYFEAFKMAACEEKDLNAPKTAIQQYYIELQEREAREKQLRQQLEKEKSSSPISFEELADLIDSFSNSDSDSEDENPPVKQEEEQKEEAAAEEENEEEVEEEEEEEEEDEKDSRTLVHISHYKWPSNFATILNRRAFKDTLQMYRRLVAENKVPSDLKRNPISTVIKMKNSGQLTEVNLLEYYYNYTAGSTPFHWLQIKRYKDGELLFRDGIWSFDRYYLWDVVKCQQFVKLADVLLEKKIDPAEMSGKWEEKLAIVKSIASEKKLDELSDLDISSCAEHIEHIRHQEKFRPELLSMYNYLAEYKNELQKLTRKQKLNLLRKLESKFPHIVDQLIVYALDDVYPMQGKLKPEKVEALGKKRSEEHVVESVPLCPSVLEFMRYKLARAVELGVICKNSEGVYVDNFNLRIP